MQNCANLPILLTPPQGHEYLSKDLLADGPGAHGDGPQGPDHRGDGPRLDELRVVRVVRADLPEREPVADAEHDVTWAVLSGQMTTRGGGGSLFSVPACILKTASLGPKMRFFNR